MANFWKKRQEIIDGYLMETGRNMFVASEFIDWLAERPDHEAYPWFFAKDDAEAAREYRIGLARRMASGMRVVARTETTETNVVQITESSYPAYVSPVAGRSKGGGYERFDPDDAEAMAELQRQGAVALRSWLDRYQGAFDAMGLDVSPLVEIAAPKRGVVASA